MNEDQGRLVTDNLKLVHKVAQKYVAAIQDSAVDYDDLYSEGCVGLVKAAQGFDPGKGIEFSTYAYRTIDGLILRFIRRGGYSVPYNVVDVAGHIRRNDLHDKPANEIAASAGCSKQTAENALLFLRLKRTSLDTPLGDDHDAEPLGSIIPSSEDYSVVYANEFLSLLSPNQRFVIDGLLNNQSCREIGKRCGITHQGVFNRLVKIRIMYMEYAKEVVVV